MRITSARLRSTLKTIRSAGPPSAPERPSRADAPSALATMLARSHGLPVPPGRGSVRYSAAASATAGGSGPGAAAGTGTSSGPSRGKIWRTASSQSDQPAGPARAAQLEATDNPEPAGHAGLPPNCQSCTSMAAYLAGVRMARAASGSGARTSAAVPSQLVPSSDNSGP